MRLLERYIGFTVLTSTLLVLSALLAMYGLMTFVNELEDVGRNQYGLLQAVSYVTFLLPRFAYELIPMSALIGSLMGLGMLANHGELTAMRAAGISVHRIMGAVLKVGVVLIVIMILIGEWLAPASEAYASRERAKAMARQYTVSDYNGFWARSGNRFINARSILPDGRMVEVSIFEYDDQHRLLKLSRAQTAVHDGKEWLLRNVVQSVFGETRIETYHHDQLVEPELIEPGLAAIVTMEPERLSARDLWRYVAYLQKNGLESDRYQAAFWMRVAAPLVLLVMLLISLPFVFGSTRSVPVGQRIMVGVLIGIGFHILAKTASHFGQAYHVSPMVSGILPVMMVLIVAIIMLRRLR